MMEPTKLGLDSRERIELVDLSVDVATMHWSNCSRSPDNKLKVQNRDQSSPRQISLHESRN